MSDEVFDNSAEDELQKEIQKNLKIIVDALEGLAKLHMHGQQPDMSPTTADQLLFHTGRCSDCNIPLEMKNLTWTCPNCGGTLVVSLDAEWRCPDTIEALILDDK